MDQQGQPWGPAGDCSGNCKRNRIEKCTGKCKGNHRGHQSGNCTGNCNGNHSEKCTGSCKVNCNHSGNWTGKCTGNCIGNHTENCKGNCNGNSSGSRPPAAGEPIKSLCVALSLSLQREDGLLWPELVKLEGSWHHDEPPWLPGLARQWDGFGWHQGSSLSRDPADAGGLPCGQATWGGGGWQLSPEPCSGPALHAWPHISYCLIICISNQK